MNDITIDQLLSPKRKAKKRLIIGFLIIILLIVVGIFIYQVTKVEVKLVTNEGEKVVSTHAHTVDQLLKEKKLEITEHDKLSPSGGSKIEEGMTVYWEHAKPISIKLNDEVIKVWTTDKLVKDILAEANITVGLHDKLSVALDSEVDKNREIIIQQAFQVTVVDGLDIKKYWTTFTTVSNFLKEKNIKLGELDRVNYSFDSYIKADTKLKVIRVEKETEVVEESVAFSTEKKQEPNLLAGKKEVYSEGRNGKKERTYEIVKENGKVVAKSVIAEEVTREPVTEVISVGTKIVEPIVAATPEQSISDSSNDYSNDLSSDNYLHDASSVFATVDNEPTSSKQELYVEATAYTPFCTGCSGITKMGINVRINTNIKVIAVDPSVIPLGSKVWVEGYGYAIAADTGGDIKNDRIDVLMHSNSEAFIWGRKRVKLLIL
ncbi:ubiquitin-like domain-containing protein [Solibacillus sp. NPDC093137]|uniref:ubiquitin-like domain-containing protein n=1 Tax=Solibacillus sp. NPDC093137 TaxID=3390678 RepID=UPI003D08B6E3